jgi:hypothetical protein
MNANDLSGLGSKRAPTRCSFQPAGNRFRFAIYFFLIRVRYAFKGFPSSS